MTVKTRATIPATDELDVEGHRLVHGSLYGEATRSRAREVDSWSRDQKDRRAARSHSRRVGLVERVSRQLRRKDIPMTDVKSGAAPVSDTTFDVSGHYLLHEWYAVDQATQRSREADAWSRSELLKRESEAAGNASWRHPSKTRLVAMAAPSAGLVIIVALASGAIA